jgi:hypothetical protein
MQEKKQTSSLPVMSVRATPDCHCAIGLYQPHDNCPAIFIVFNEAHVSPLVLLCSSRNLKQHMLQNPLIIKSSQCAQRAKVRF